MRSTNYELFAKHVNLGIFIETGTCWGRSVEMALRIEFHDIRSVEADKERFLHCNHKFASAERVKLWHGESAFLLPAMIYEVRSPALFLLDAHPSGDGSFGQDYETNPAHHQSAVLRAELQIIHDHPVKGHVILIDDLTPDVNDFVRGLFPEATFNLYSVEDGVDKVLEVLT